MSQSTAKITAEQSDITHVISVGLCLSCYSCLFVLVEKQNESKISFG